MSRSCWVYWPAVSKNPYFRCNFAGKAGDTVKVSWIDNRGVEGLMKIW